MDTKHQGPQASPPETLLNPTDDATFPPPDDPITVVCLHCGREYLSSEMVFQHARDPMPSGFWWCPTPGCDAGGFGLDIFPADPTWKDPKGLLECVSGPDEEDEEFEFDDDDVEF